MKVIKRNGQSVDYDPEKIRIAIKKANVEVTLEEQVSETQIKNIIKYIESLGKKRMLVEDIQDIIEKKLMEQKKFDLAKKYVIYRYTRALVRKANTTDQSILSLIKNNDDIYDKSSHNYLVSGQRDLIAGEVSKDITKRILLPIKIVKAHEEGVLYFHDMNYFIQPLINTSLINISDMLEKGTVMNGKMIETPKSFTTAMNILIQIILQVSFSQYGSQVINVSHVSKYLKVTYDKFYERYNKLYKNEFDKNMIKNFASLRMKDDLQTGIQSLLYQLNTSLSVNGKMPKVSLFLYLDKNDPYLNETSMIIEEILKQSLIGIKDSKGLYKPFEEPNYIYCLDEDNSFKGGKYDYLTNLTISCCQKGYDITYLSAFKISNIYNNIIPPMPKAGFLPLNKNIDKIYGRFNQGVVSINLPQISFICSDSKEKFFDLLNERLELCKEALLCKYYSLQGTKAYTLPIHFQYGAISRIDETDSINKCLDNDYSSLAIGYVGLYEASTLMYNDKEEKEKFAIKVLKYMKEQINKWQKDTGIGFGLLGISDDFNLKRLTSVDKEKYGKVKNITDKDVYTNSYLEEKDIFKRLKKESVLGDLSNLGFNSIIDIKDLNEDEIKKLIKFIYEETTLVSLIKK